MTIIYLLKCPITGDVRYIGKADDLAKRLRRHLREAANDRAQYYRVRWIRTLTAAGMQPLIESLFMVPTNAEWQCFERFFIASAKAFGFALTNATSGGEGVELMAQDSLRRKQLAHKLCWEKPEYRKLIAATRAAAELRPEVKERRSEALRNNWKKPDYAKRISTLVKQAYSSDEARAAQSSRAKAAWSNDSLKAVRIASIIASNKRPGVKEGRAKAVKNALATPKSKAKQSAASQARWDDPVWREKRIKQMRSPEARARMKSAQSNPETNSRRSASQKAAWRRKLATPPQPEPA